MHDRLATSARNTRELPCANGKRILLREPLTAGLGFTHLVSRRTQRIRKQLLRQQLALCFTRVQKSHQSDERQSMQLKLHAKPNRVRAPLARESLREKLTRENHARQQRAIYAELERQQA